jgi:hypothetical protein
MSQSSNSKRPKLGRVSVRAEKKQPEPDWDKFAWTLLQYAKVLQAKEQQPGPTPPPDQDDE